MIGEPTYHRPRALQEAFELGRSLGQDARYLAGGTEILVDWKRKKETAAHLISLRGVRELREIRQDGDTLRIGSMATLAEIARTPEVERAFPVLREAIANMGGVQIRNQATIGGNFCRAVPCADTPPVCIAGEARLELLGPSGERTLPAEEFFTGARQTALEPGELLVGVAIPTQPPASGSSYQRFSLRKGSAVAVASVAARVVLDGDTLADARVVLGAVAPIPLWARETGRALVGKSPGEGLFSRAAEAAAEEAKPISDVRGSKEYRRHLVRVLTLRALEAATARARGA